MGTIKLVKLVGVEAVQHAIHEKGARLYLRPSLAEEGRELALAEGFALVARGRESDVFAWKMEGLSV